MIKYTNNGTTTIISELDPEHQCRMLQLIGESLNKTKVIQYEFNEALKAFTVLSPSDKRKEIKSWIIVMEKILYRGTHEKKNSNIKIRNMH